MLKIRLIRHAESLANTGICSNDPANAALSPRGHRQADALAASIGEPPTLLICSPLLRARQTAAPVLARYPSLSAEILPIEEFNLLGDARARRTSAIQRAPWIAGYWQRADPLERTAVDAENFAEFIGRVRRLLGRLTTLPDENTLLVGHGEFLKAIAWLIEEPVDTAIDAPAMRRFARFSSSLRIDNTGGFHLYYARSGWQRQP